jgi:hypothetical protein
MSTLDQAVKTQIVNIQTKTGKSLAQLTALVKKSGLTRHSEIRDMLKRELGLGHGDANALAHATMQSDGTRAAAGLSAAEVLDGIYAGPKAALRPIHDALMAAITTFGEFEVLPKKGYVSLRRKKQFAMLGPGANTRVDVGINMKGVPATERLIALPAGGMCQYNVRVTTVKEVDKELIAWIKQAYEAAG